MTASANSSPRHIIAVLDTVGALGLEFQGSQKESILLFAESIQAWNSTYLRTSPVLESWQGVCRAGSLGS